MGYFSAQEAFDMFASKQSEGRIQGFDINTAPAFITIYRNSWGDVRSWEFNGKSVTLEDTAAWLDSLHESIADGCFLQWKSLRPWDVVDITASLDKSKAWIGWEVETGWNSSVARSNVISKFFDSYQWVCTDDEGPECGVELTWCPREVDYYDDTNHPLLWVARLRNDHYEHNPWEHVGTHINVSTPTFRTLDYRGRCSVTSALNRGLASLAYSERESLFGRSDLYAGFFERGNRASTQHWLEGKLFNSTYELSTARDYITVGNNIAMLVEHLSQAVSGQGAVNGTTVCNFLEVLDLGAVPEIEVKGGGYVSGDHLYIEDEDDDLGWLDEEEEDL